jgi:hypothetical protein
MSSVRLGEIATIGPSLSCDPASHNSKRIVWQRPLQLEGWTTTWGDARSLVGAKSLICVVGPSGSRRDLTLALKRTSRRRFWVSANEQRFDSPREALRPRSNHDGEPVAGGRLADARSENQARSLKRRSFCLWGGSTA